MTDPAAVLRRRMVDGLAARGELDQAWRNAFLAVPRHEFIPELVWRHDTTIAAGRDLVPLRRCDDPGGWLELAYADAAVNTQVDDGRGVAEGSAGWEVSSSASMPTVVAQMLAALWVEPGMSVVEIGTGTGYNAALLAHHLGGGSVTSVEVDPAVAAQARRALAANGYGGVIVVTADGASGHPPGAPFDRVICTAAVQTVPPAWVAQTRLGGRIVVPWGTPYFNGGLLALTVTEPGRAIGRIVGHASFMWLREQRIPRFTPDTVGDQSGAAESHTELHPYEVAGDRGAATAIGLRVPRCRFVYVQDDGGILWLVDQWTRSWATLRVADDGPPYPVRQAGQRKLWDEVESAHRWWVRADSPTAGDWRFTIDQHEQRIDLPARLPLD